MLSRLIGRYFDGSELCSFPGLIIGSICAIFQFSGKHPFLRHSLYSAVIVLGIALNISFSISLVTPFGPGAFLGWNPSITCLCVCACVRACVCRYICEVLPLETKQSRHNLLPYSDLWGVGEIVSKGNIKQQVLQQEGLQWKEEETVQLQDWNVEHKNL